MVGAFVFINLVVAVVVTNLVSSYGQENSLLDKICDLNELILTLS